MPHLFYLSPAFSVGVHIRIPSSFSVIFVFVLVCTQSFFFFNGEYELIPCRVRSDPRAGIRESDSIYMQVHDYSLFFPRETTKMIGLGGRDYRSKILEITMVPSRWRRRHRYLCTFSVLQASSANKALVAHHSTDEARHRPSQTVERRRGRGVVEVGDKSFTFQIKKMICCRLRPRS